MIVVVVTIIIIAVVVTIVIALGLSGRNNLLGLLSLGWGLQFLNVVCPRYSE